MDDENDSPTVREILIRFEAHEQRDVDRFEASMTQFREGVKTLVDKIEEIRRDVTAQVSDHEARIRTVEVAVTRVTTWGTMALVLLGIFEFTLQFFLK